MKDDPESSKEYTSWEYHNLNSVLPVMAFHYEVMRHEIYNSKSHEKEPKTATAD